LASKIEVERLQDIPTILGERIRTIDGIQSTTSLVTLPIRPAIRARPVWTPPDYAKIRVGAGPEEENMTAQVVHRTFVDRMIGAARLDSSVYEEVEGDGAATAQAAVIVVLAAISAGIGVITGGVGAIVALAIAGLISWAAFALVAYWVGTHWFAGPQTSASWGEVFRTLGFADTPGLLLILGVIPYIGWIIQLVIYVWILMASVIALRQALDFGTGEAVGTAVVSWLAYFVISFVVDVIVR